MYKQLANGQTDIQIDGQAGGQTNTLKDRQEDRNEKDGGTDLLEVEQKNGKANGERAIKQMERQIKTLSICDIGQNTWTMAMAKYLPILSRGDTER